MKNYFIRVFEYDKAVNITIADELLKINKPPEKCKILLYHIGAALDLWYNRTTHQLTNIKSLFQEDSIEDSKRLLIENDDKWIEYLKSIKEEDLHEEIVYKNTKGNEYKNKVEDILTHLITHSHYHRGQINSLLRENGYEPVLTDYIFYLRD